MIEKFFTTEQVANILQVHPFTILKLIKQGKLQGIKLGRVYRIKESEVKEFLERSSSKPKSKAEPQKKDEHIQKEDPSPHFKVDEDQDNSNEHYYII